MSSEKTIHCRSLVHSRSLKNSLISTALQKSFAKCLRPMRVACILIMQCPAIMDYQIKLCHMAYDIWPNYCECYSIEFWSSLLITLTATFSTANGSTNFKWHCYVVHQASPYKIVSVSIPNSTKIWENNFTIAS